MTNKEKYDNLISEINWYNWHNKENNKYFDLSEVLYLRLEWIKDYFSIDDEDNSEHINTIDIVQQLLQLLDEKKIKTLLDEK